MRATLAPLLLLSACNHWVRPQPEQARPRGPDEQHRAAVEVVVSCVPGEAKSGSGVMVSDWQVLTARHVIDCGSHIPHIRVTTVEGTWYMAHEKEWKKADVARLQLASSDRLRPSMAPPAIGAKPELEDMLYMHTAVPMHAERNGMASGWTYYGPKTGGDSGWFAYRVYSEPGNSGAGIYDIDGRLVGIHLGPWGYEKYGALLTSEMVPGN